MLGATSRLGKLLLRAGRLGGLWLLLCRQGFAGDGDGGERSDQHDEAIHDCFKGSGIDLPEWSLIIGCGKASRKIVPDKR
jgi:hypothetical protein